MTTATRLVPAVHSGVDRGKLETSRGAGSSFNKTVFWFPFSLDPVFLGELSTSFGKESANAPQMKSESKHDSKPVTFFKNAKVTDLNLRVCQQKNTPKSSKQTDLFESVRAFLL